MRSVTILAGCGKDGRPEPFDLSLIHIYALRGPVQPEAPIPAPAHRAAYDAVLPRPPHCPSPGAAG